MGMDTFRRRSHPTVAEHRQREIEDLLGRVLRQYRVAFTFGEHNCDSCLTDVEIFEDKARALGVKLREKPPF